MNLDFLTHDLSNPTILFFLLGIIAVLIKSDLKFQNHLSNSFRFIFCSRLALEAGKNFNTAHGPQKFLGLWSLVWPSQLAFHSIVFSSLESV